MLLVQGRIPQRIWLPMCLQTVLSSQGIVVKCTAAMFFTVRWIETIVLKAMCTLYRIALVQAAKTFRIGLLFTHKTPISDRFL